MTTINARQELTARIAMLDEAIASVTAAGEDATAQATLRARYAAELAALGDHDGPTYRITAEEGTKKALTDRPTAGSTASNQYGTFAVHYASEKQTAFIERLLRTRDTSRLGEGVTGLDVAKLTAQVAARRVNKKAASAIIDRLLACPEIARPATATQPATGTPATDKQIAFIRKLAAERDLTPEQRAAVESAKLTAKGASATIEKLLALPKVERVEAELEAGMYRKADGRIYKVQRAVHGSGRMTAKLLVLGEQGEKATFEYQGLATRFVSADERMTLEQAKAFGALYGVCCNCGATLTDEGSIEAGIGPVCAQRFAS